MRNKQATTRAIRGGVRFTHRGVNYLQVGTGWMGRIIRERDGRLVAWTQFEETAREAIDRALADGHPMTPRTEPRLHKFQRSRQFGRIISDRVRARRELLATETKRRK
jgi:hypothetical protein